MYTFMSVIPTIRPHSFK